VDSNQNLGSTLKIVEPKLEPGMFLVSVDNNNTRFTASFGEVAPVTV